MTRPVTAVDVAVDAAVDVVVPTRDRPELLRETIGTILASDHPGPVRVLVVFDQAEPDATLTQAPSGDGPARSVQVLANTARRPGLAGARNTGLLAADAPLVAFCDDDDTWLPDKLRRQVALLAEHPDAVLASCGIEIDYAGTRSPRVLDAPVVGFADLLRSRLTELHPSTFLLRRAVVVDDIGLVEEDIPGSYAEDYEFLLRIARRAPVVLVPEVGIRVRWHQQSYFSQRWSTIEQALDWLLSRYPEFDGEPQGHGRVLGQIAFAVAAQGRRADAGRRVRRTLAVNPREPRAYLALAVASGAVGADTVMRQLHRRGKGL